MKKSASGKSGFFNPRVLIALALCSVGVFLAMLSLAATPRVQAPRDSANVPSTFGSNANRLSPGVPLPPGTQFSPNEHGDPSSSSSTAGFPGVAPMPLRPGAASDANSLAQEIGRASCRERVEIVVVRGDV